MAVETRKTVCNRDCPDACSIVATVEAGRVTKLGGDRDHPVTRGFLCWRTHHFLNLQYGPDRVLAPLVRTASGDFRAVSWDDALDLIAERLMAFRRESGPASIFHYRSGGSLGILGHLVDRFFQLFGPVTTKRGDICSGAGEAAQTIDFGESESNDLFDLLNARHILLWGKNVHVSTPHTIPVLRDAKARGARLALIDPVHHRAAGLCERFWQPRPGGDFALAMAVARRLFDRGLVDARAGSYCDNLDGFRALAHRHDAAAWCRQADVPVAAADDIGDRLADGPTAILVGWGMGRRRNGGAIVRALDALGAVTGNVGVSGGGVSYYFKRRRGFDTTFGGTGARPPRTILEPRFGPELLAAADPPVRAVWITAGNPVVMLPEAQTTARALATRELVVVADSFLTDTARLAHVVLPTPTLLESDDVLGAYGHHYLGVARPVVAPPDGVRSDLEIAQALAARVGLASAMAGSAREWKARLIRREAADGGASLEALEEGARRNPLAPRIAFAGQRFSTANGRANLLTEAEPPPLGSSPDYPLFLMSLSTDRSQSSQWSEPETDALACTVHPEVASAAGVADGGRAVLQTAVGSLPVVVRCDPHQRRDVAIVPKGGHLRSQRCANALLRAEVTDIGEGGALYDEGARLVAG
ncbi:MAG TPA: molybdopterin-dependent oxidoreductase [Polyangia bacterium]|nr:molybdopterin-dependent oxidoreductase [Polyangia bacterium]